MWMVKEKMQVWFIVKKRELKTQVKTEFSQSCLLKFIQENVVINHKLVENLKI